MRPKYPDAARVWQRVHPSEPQEQQTLQMMIRQLSMDITYLKQRNKTGDDPTVGQLIREYAKQLHSLRGILILTGSSLPREAGAIPDHSLHRCYDHALQRLAAYQLRSSDPVYGPVFRELSTETAHCCFCITQLLGNSR